MIRFGSLIALLIVGVPVCAGAATISVAVTAANQATVGVTYSSGSAIACDPGTSVAGVVPCAQTATLAGSIRSTHSDPGGTSISLTGFAITGAGGASIPPSAFQLTCSGGVVGNPAFPGTPGTLANHVPLSTSAVPCGSWTGTVVASYSLVVALALDTGQVPADTYAAVAFNAIATAN